MDHNTKCFNEEIDSDEKQHKLGKEIIQDDSQDLKRMPYFQPADNSLMYVDSGGQALAHNIDDLSGDRANIELHGVAVSKNNATEIVEGEVAAEDRAEKTLVEMLWGQIKSHALNETVEQALKKEKMENLVSKVKEEVELEGIIEDMCLRYRAEEEFMDMERRERDWERERQEVRLEEEVELLRRKVKSLEEEICISNESKDVELQKKVAKVHDLVTIQLLSQLESSNTFQNSDGTQQGFLNVSREDHVGTLSKLFPLAEENSEQDQRILENILQKEQQAWSASRQELENQKHFLEMELKCLNTMLKEKESALSLERERRRQYGIEVDKVLAFWRDENLVYNSVCQRLNKIQDILPEFLQKVTPLIRSLELNDGLPELLENLTNTVNEKIDLSIPSKGRLQLEWDLVDGWKAQRDQLEGERDILEALLEEATMVAKENKKKIEILQQENNWNLMQKQKILDGHTCTGNLALNPSSLNQKEMLEIHASAHKNAWLDEKQKVLGMMAERERLIDEHSRNLAALLNEKDEELIFLRSVHQKLECSLSKSKRRLLNLKKRLVGYGSGVLEELVLNERNSVSSHDTGGPCNSGNDLGLNTGIDLVTSNEISGQDDCGHAYYVDVEQLAKDISKEIGKLSKELWREQDRLEKERKDIQIGTEQLKEERRELEKKVTDTLIVMEELKEKIKEKEGLLEWERKQMDSILAARMEEEENLKQQLNSREQQIKSIVQNFGNEISAVQSELAKERKEREEITELHCASRKKLIEETREIEMKWESEIECVSQEMQGLRAEIDERNKQVSRLKKELREFQQEVMPDRQLKQAKHPFGNNLQSDYPPEDEKTAGCCVHELNSKNMQNTVLMKFVRSDIEWQDVIEKMAKFDEQIAEAMLTIQSLREQLDAKEKELQKAKLERDMDRETPWIQEQSETFEMVYRNRIINVPHELDYGQREHLYLGDNEDLVKLLEAERADTADAMCILQGAVRELQWALYDYKGKDGEASILNMAKEPHSFSSNEGFVKVHASHLEDLDRFIIDLKLKADEAEKRARNAEVALAIKAVKEAAKSTESGSALVTFEKDWNDNKILKSMGGDVGLPYISNSLRKASQFERKYPDTTIRTLRTLQHRQKWSEGSPESWQIWDVSGRGSFGAGRDDMSNGSSNGWMISGCTEDSFSIQDSFEQGPLTLAVSIPPRSQRRWLVDGLWLENVRKEQSLMRQQLEVERQRVSELKQVEVENRWMEATIRQALEQKKISDIKVLDLEKKVAFLETMITQKNSNEEHHSLNTVYMSTGL